MNSVGPLQPLRPLQQRLRAGTSAAAIAMAIGAGGCAAEVYPAPVAGYATVYATNVPPDMSVYPRVAYSNDYAYLVGNRWYYPNRYPGGTRWVVLQQEPPQLYRYRTTYVPAGPRVYRAPSPYPRQYAPPGQYGYPPPADRVP
jgi:hypothetical protein